MNTFCCPYQPLLTGIGLLLLGMVCSTTLLPARQR